MAAHRLSAAGAQPPLVAKVVGFGRGKDAENTTERRGENEGWIDMSYLLLVWVL
jgi:hypothetical protein